MSVTVALAAAALSGCAEQLESVTGCPVLCPQPDLEVRDTILDVVSLDTTLAGFPALGEEGRLLLASRGDSLDTRVILRFDSLPATFRAPSGSDSAITRVDSATVVARLVLPTLNDSSPVTIEVYDVDTTAADTLPETLLPLFRADRLIGSHTLTPASITDTTLRIPVSDSAVLSKIVGGERLRLGLRVREEGRSGQLVLESSNGGTPPRLTFRVHDDTTVTCCVRSPVLLRSKTPETLPFVAAQLQDYVLVARQPLPTVPTGTLAVGGLSGRRSLLRFALPSQIVDSATVVRATLLLTQRPNTVAPSASDSVTLLVMVPAARTAITDLKRQISLISSLYLVEGALAPSERDFLRVPPSESTVRQIELGPLLRAWRALRTDPLLQSLVLRAADERERSSEVLFYSSEAAPELRPRLRITYVPRGGYGVP